MLVHLASPPPWARRNHGDIFFIHLPLFLKLHWIRYSNRTSA